MFSRSTIPLILAVSCPAQPWTEARVVELFSRQSPQASAARAQAAVVRAEARGRALYSNPSLGYSREGAGFTEFFQAEQALPLSGRIGILRQAVAPAVAAAEADADALIWQLRSEVRLAFYRLLALQGREAVAGSTVQDLREIIRVLTTGEKEGEVSRFDRLRGERELVEVRAEVNSIEAQAAQARARLLQFLPPGTEIGRVEGTVDGTPTVPALADLLSRAVAARSEIRMDNQLAARLRLEQQAAGRLRYPEPVATAGLKRAEAGKTGVLFGLTIPIPTFNRGQTEVTRLQAEQARVEAHRSALEHQIRVEVIGAYQALSLRRQTLETYRTELGERSRDLLGIARVAYQEGEVGILELLDALRLRRQSEQRLIELGAAAREAQIELDRAMGEEVTR